jgi:catechol 2,3-dioxygenase-like lactoylglutathione lyase family enzyme
MIRRLDHVAIAVHLANHGDGLHHICFGVDDVARDASALAGSDGAQVTVGRGRGRVSAFVPCPPRFGVSIECTEFKLEEDGYGTSGWLDG